MGYVFAFLAGCLLMSLAFTRRTMLHQVQIRLETSGRRRAAEMVRAVISKL